MSYDELKNLSTDEITNELKLIDYQMMQNHRQGIYVKSPWLNGTVLTSKIDDDTKKEIHNAINMDIIGLCIEGICAYNRFSLLPTTAKDFNRFIQNLEMYFEHGSVPSIMQKYYIDVLNRQNINYLNNYLYYNYENTEGQEKGRTLTKSTTAGRYFSERENAFASVLLLPAMLVLIYISVVVIYFVFFYNG